MTPTRWFLVTVIACILLPFVIDEVVHIIGNLPEAIRALFKRRDRV